MTQDPRENPYAPPAAELARDAEAREVARIEYEDEQRSVLFVVLVSVVTLGVYPSIWYLRRARFFDGLDASKKIGALPWIPIALTAVGFCANALDDGRKLAQLATSLAGLAQLLLAFRGAAILRSDLRRTGRLMGVSSVMVFFFGCLYLQHVINVAARTPARIRRAGSSDA